MKLSIPLQCLILHSAKRHLTSHFPYQAICLANRLRVLESVGFVCSLRTRIFVKKGKEKFQKKNRGEILKKNCALYISVCFSVCFDLQMEGYL